MTGNSRFTRPAGIFPRNNGFTLVELLIAVVIFTMVSGLVFLAFSQSLSLWDRADKEIDKLDQLVFVNTWVKDVFHSAENFMLDYQNKRAPIFIGDPKKVLFITSNPLLSRNKITSFVRIEFRGTALIYAEESLFAPDLVTLGPAGLTFEKEYPLLTDIEEGVFSYFVPVNGLWTWAGQSDSEKSLALPKGVQLIFSYKGKRVEITAAMFANAMERDPSFRRDIL
ncbi:MAG: prepilin-type N-terminal cleavage/methylation domain-containing protein [Candidatus Aminicenantales bacterium]